MKNFYLLMCMLFLVPLAEAQVVNIPDANFKKYLIDVIKIDANNDGEIQVSEAESRVNLYIHSNTSKIITDFTGLEAFINIQGLGFYNPLFTGTIQIPASLRKLDALHFEGTKFTQINLPELPKLTYLRIRDNSELSDLQISTEYATIETIRIIKSPKMNHVNFLSKLKNAVTLVFQENHSVSNLDLTGFMNLKEIYCDTNSNLTKVQIDGLSSLEDARLSYNEKLSDLTVANLPKLTELRCHNNSALSTLDVSSLTALEELHCNFNALTTLDVSSLTALENLYCNGNKLTTLNVSGATALENLNCRKNNLTTLDVSGATALKQLFCEHNNLTTLVSSNTALDYLKCSDNALTTLDVSSNTALKTLICSNNALTTLDVTTNPKLTRLECLYNSLQRAFLKNGRSISHNFVGNPNLKYICANDNDIEILSRRYPNAEVNGYCSFQPGNYETIKGTIQLDADKDGCGNGADNYLLLNHKIFVNYPDKSTHTIYAYSKGTYTAYVPKNASYTVTSDYDTADFNITPSTHTVSFPQQTSPVTADFCITAKNPHTDVSAIAVIKSEGIRPGFPVILDVIITNNGSTVSTGSLQFFYDANQLDYVSSDPVGNTATNSVSWTYANLLPFESRKYEVRFNAKTPTDPQNPLNGGDVVEYRAKITPNQTDINPDDNEHIGREVVVNSFDPNDIMCIEGKDLLLEKIGEKIHYRIRFENLGTASAVNIVVKNYIDPTMFDLTTLKPISASHDFVTRIRGDNVEFIFENIHLPFDDATNDGYLIYQIENLSTHVEGSKIENEASIYFDYNFPVITNKEISTFVSALSVDTIADSAPSVYPNPADGELFFTQHDQIMEVRVYDLTGKQHTAGKPTNGKLDISHLDAGIYMLQLETTAGKTTQKIIKE